MQGLVTTTTPGDNAAAVRGENKGTNANGSGVIGTHAGGGSGVKGVLTSDTLLSESAGVHGQINSTGSYTGAGVRGIHESNGYGGYFEAKGSSGTGVYSAGGYYGSYNYATQPGSTAVYASGVGRGIDAYAEAATGTTYGVFADADSSDGGHGVMGRADGASGINYGVRGEVYSPDGFGGHFQNIASGNTGVGVQGWSSGTSVSAVPGGYFAGGGEFTGGNGVVGVSDRASGYGVVGVQGPGSYAGYFNGNVYVSGVLSKASGTFKIDHPLDPANKYLSHSFVESPDMMNIYNGNVTLDKKGQAVVKMPDYFTALNREFRYQLTAIGAPGPNLYVAQKIANNQFKIAGGKAGTEISWQVTGVRKDAYANANRVAVVEEKKGRERGAYLHPELFGHPKEKAIGYAQQFDVTKAKSSRIAQQAPAKSVKK